MIEDLDALFDRLDELAGQARREAESQPTAERWSAVQCLDDATRYVFSAAAWLRRNEAKTSTS